MAKRGSVLGVSPAVSSEASAKQPEGPDLDRWLIALASSNCLGLRAFLPLSRVERDLSNDVNRDGELDAQVGSSRDGSIFSGRSLHRSCRNVLREGSCCAYERTWRRTCLNRRLRLKLQCY